MSPKKNPPKKNPKKSTKKSTSAGPPSVASVLASVRSQYGAEVIQLLGAVEDRPKIPAISTGSMALDDAIGIGGVPRGRIVEIYGPESSGKTTLTLHLVANAQKEGLACAFIDAEHALDPAYAEALGVDLNTLMLSQPDYGEQALNVVMALAQSGAVGLVIVDSVAALTPKAEIDGEIGDNHVGRQARMMSQTMRKLASVAHRTGTTVVFINQIRMKIGVMFGSPETTPGGNALKFYASVRLDIRRIKQLKEGEQVTGGMTRVRVRKNKVAPPFREAEFVIRYGTGIDRIGELLDLGTDTGILDKRGSWFWFGEDRIGNGRAAAREALENQPDTAAKIRAEVLDVMERTR